MCFCCLKRRAFGFYSLSLGENRISQTQSALLLGLKCFHIRIKSLACSHFIELSGTETGLRCHHLSFFLPPPPHPPLFLPVKKMGQMERSLLAWKRKSFLSKLYIYTQLGECVLLFWGFFCLLRQWNHCNCKGGFSYTNGCVSAYSHKRQGLDNPKTPLADKRATQIRLFILPSYPEGRDRGL